MGRFELRGQIAGEMTFSKVRVLPAGRNGGRYRTRTYDLLRVKQML
jgi:hypothetical protein